MQERFDSLALVDLEAVRLCAVRASPAIRGAKVPLPHGRFEGEDDLRKNVRFHRHATCRSIPCAIRLAEACKALDISWWEEVHRGARLGL